MATINEVLSDELKVPELKPGEIVKFRMLKKGQIDPMADDGRSPMVLANYYQQGKEVIYDGFKDGEKGNKNVLLLNATGVLHTKNPETGITREEPIVSMIEWDSTGEKIYTEEQFETICFLKRSNKNKSNPYRNKRRKALFYEVNEAVVVSTKLFNEEMDLRARNWVMDADLKEQKAMAAKLGIPVSNDKLDNMKLSLLEKVRKDPKSVVIASSNTKMKKKVQVMDAELYGILLWDPTSRNYYFKDNLGEMLCNVSPDMDKLEGILKFFTTDEGKGYYKKLTDSVAKLYTAIV